MNKVDIEIKYGYYTDKEFEDNPLFAISKFNVNTVLLLLERMIRTTFTKGKKELQYYNKVKGKTEGKKYFSKLKIIRGSIHHKSLLKSSERWFFELSVWDNYNDYREGLLKYSILHNGFIEWNLVDLYNRIAATCEKWDEEIFKEVIVENLKPIFRQHNILSMKDFIGRIEKADKELFNFEDMVRKRKWEENEKVKKIFDAIDK